MRFAGKVAVVTGAASGIGRMLAVNLAREGCNLAICDINAEGLNETAKLIVGNVRVSTHVVDVSKREQVYAFADEAAAYHGVIDMIINNAGTVVSDFVETIPIEDLEWLFGTNFWGVVHGTMAFLPYLRKRPEGHVVNFSSINGIVPNPNHAPYCSSKYAVRGYTETLAQEMQGTSIRVSCVHPGGVYTNIARNARVNRTLYNITKEQAARLYDDLIFRLTADEAAKIIIAGIKRNRLRIMVGADAKVLDLCMRLFPVTTVKIGGYIARFVARRYANK